MLGNSVEMSLVFCRILGPLVWGWASNYFVLGAQLALCEKRLVCIPACADTFANKLEPDQAGQNTGPALDPNCLTL